MLFKSLTIDRLNNTVKLLIGIKSSYLKLDTSFWVAKCETMRKNMPQNLDIRGFDNFQVLILIFPIGVEIREFTGIRGMVRSCPRYQKVNFEKTCDTRFWHNADEIWLFVRDSYHHQQLPWFKSIFWQRQLRVYKP